MLSSYLCPSFLCFRFNMLTIQKLAPSWASISCYLEAVRHNNFLIVFIIIHIWFY